MKLITFPIRVLFRLALLPVKLVLVTAWLTLRTGFKVGTLPARGGVVASRALGFKAILLFVLGLVGGVAIARRFGPQLGLFGPTEGAMQFGYANEGDSFVDEAVAAEPTADGGAVVVDDTVVVTETPDGEVVTETVTVDAVSAEELAEVEASVGEPGDGVSLERDADDV